MDMAFAHVPVLARQCMEGLAVWADGVYVDATTGGGNHSALIAQKLTTGRLICLDRDDDALAAAKLRLAPWLEKITFVKTNFEELAPSLDALGIPAADGILFDLGTSSWHLDSPQRGFSYMHPGPLDMRMDQQESLTAREVVNTYGEAELRDILIRYGEERYAGRIAAAIVRRRQEQDIETTLELSELIKSAMPAAARREKQHPAKRSFQAIRVEVNGELRAIETGVAAGIDRLAPGGRIAVISFQSLEDRRVKQIFTQRAQGCVCHKSLPVCVCGQKPQIKLISRGAITADEQELAENPRARSAKLRVAEKL